MRLRDARRLDLDALLTARAVADENLSPRDAKLDGKTLESELREEGIDLGDSAMEKLLRRLTGGPLLTRKELRDLIHLNLPTLLDDGWEVLDPEEFVGRMYAFRGVDTVLTRSDGEKTMAPLAIEQEAADGLGPLLLSTERVREAVRDERETEKKRSPVLTETEDDAAYARHMTSRLASVEAVRPLLATTDPQPHLETLCDELDVDLVDLSPSNLEGRGLKLEVNLQPR